MILEHHSSSSDPYYLSWCGSRYSYYNIGGYPTVMFDGLTRVVGAGSCEGAANNYRTRINNRLEDCNYVSPLRIEGYWEVIGTAFNAHATITLEDPATLENLRVYLFAQEQRIEYGGQQYNHVTRAVYETSATLQNPGEDVTVDRTWGIPGGWDPDNLTAAVIIQNTTTKEIYQGADLEERRAYHFEYDTPTTASIPEGIGTAEFIGTLRNTGGLTDDVTVTLDSNFGWEAQFQVEGVAGWHVDPVVVQLADGETATVTLQVSTDDEMRIGDGLMAFDSGNTGLHEEHGVLLFNGSPAILMVDADNYFKSEEVIITEALDANQLLYTHWDVTGEHTLELPSFDEMNGYDIVLWHAGWSAYSRFTDVEALSVKEFMDNGGHFILSSSQALNDLTAGAFTSDYLGVGSWELDVDPLSATGVAGDPISDGMAYDLTYPTIYTKGDKIIPSASGTVIFTSELDDGIAVRCGNRAGRSVFFAFGLNGIEAGLEDPNNITTLVRRSIEWVMPEVGQDVAEGEFVLTPSTIGSIAPNPMSLRQGAGTTTIRMQLSASAAKSPASLDLLDLNGRLVRNLASGNLPSGTATATWDGRDLNGRPVGAGVYYARLTTADGMHSARLVVLH